MRYAFAVRLLVPLLAATPAVAADPTKGGQLARQWCANCHVIGNASLPSHSSQTAQQGPPSMEAVARKGMSNDQLRAFLTHPHGQMPDLSLSRAEIDDLIAYIQTMR